MRNASVHIHFIRIALENAKQGGLEVDELLTHSRISPHLLTLQDARVSAKQFADLQTAVMVSLNDELLGYTPHPVPLGAWSLMCHWLIDTKSLWQAIKRFCRFYALVRTGFKVELTCEEALVKVKVSPWDSPESYQLYGYELFLFSFHRLLCWLARDKLPIERMDFTFPCPPHHQEYRHLFYGYPVYFEQEQCQVYFQQSLLNKPIRQDALTLATFLRHPMYEIIVQDYDQSSWSGRVKELLSAHPETPLHLEEAAQQLGLKPHTFRRRLALEGQSYGDIKRQVKRDLAIHYLSNQKNSVEDIAYKTGFSEASAFIRAFKQWTGVTPYTYRKHR